MLFDELEANEAVRVLQEFTERPTCVTIKHREAWETTWREEKEICNQESEYRIRRPGQVTEVEPRGSEKTFSPVNLIQSHGRSRPREI